MNKTNKTIIACTSSLLLIINITLSGITTVFLYKHVEATPTMWTLFILGFILNIPLVIMSQALKYTKDTNE